MTSSNQVPPKEIRDLTNVQSPNNNAHKEARDRRAIEDFYQLLLVELLAVMAAEKWAAKNTRQ